MPKPTKRQQISFSRHEPKVGKNVDHFIENIDYSLFDKRKGDMAFTIKRKVDGQLCYAETIFFLPRSLDAIKNVLQKWGLLGSMIRNSHVKPLPGGLEGVALIDKDDGSQFQLKVEKIFVNADHPVHIYARGATYGKREENCTRVWVVDETLPIRGSLGILEGFKNDNGAKFLISPSGGAMCGTKHPGQKNKNTLYIRGHYLDNSIKKG